MLRENVRRNQENEFTDAFSWFFADRWCLIFIDGPGRLTRNRADIPSQDHHRALISISSGRESWRWNHKTLDYVPALAVILVKRWVLSWPGVHRQRALGSPGQLTDRPSSFSFGSLLTAIRPQLSTQWKREGKVLRVLLSGRWLPRNQGWLNF